MFISQFIFEARINNEVDKNVKIKEQEEIIISTIILGYESIKILKA